MGDFTTHKAFSIDDGQDLECPAWIKIEEVDDMEQNRIPIRIWSLLLKLFLGFY